MSVGANKSFGLYERVDDIQGAVFPTVPPDSATTTWIEKNPAAAALQTVAGPLNVTGAVAVTGALSATTTVQGAAINGPQQELASAKAGSTDALPLFGTVYVTTAGVNGMTLATPTAGAPGTGDDGKLLTVTDTGGHAHTITTASNKGAPAHHVLTFDGTVGSFVTLQAFGGLWYVHASSGITPS